MDRKTLKGRWDALDLLVQGPPENPLPGGNHSSFSAAQGAS
jgi:hypothetical protein